MAEPIDDVSALPGREVSDQDDAPIGKITEIYANGDGFPTWVAVKVKTGIAGRQLAVVPVARLKEEDDKLRVPYSKAHILEAPEFDDEDEISEERDRELRVYYGIGTGDQEMWSDNKGYATIVSEEPGESEKVDDPEGLQTPDGDKRSDETRERMSDPGGKDMREVSAEDVFEESSGE